MHEGGAVHFLFYGEEYCSEATAAEAAEVGAELRKRTGHIRTGFHVCLELGLFMGSR